LKLIKRCPNNGIKQLKVLKQGVRRKQVSSLLENETGARWENINIRANKKGSLGSLSFLYMGRFSVLFQV